VEVVVAGEAVLIVDDNAINLKLAKLCLEAAGYRVRSAIDAEQALQVLSEFQPQLILMDIQLPGMDGLALSRQLKADVRTRDIMIVALTAYAMKGDDEKALASGCMGYITKPIDTRTFGAEVARFIRPDEAPSA